jgi:hypothetical protein
MVFLPSYPIWPKCYFKQVDLDSTVLTRSFWLVFQDWVFFIRYFLLNHCDNNIISATTIYIYTSKLFYL